MVKRIAFLATGDEIVNGDILNTNGQRMAQDLFEAGAHPGRHMVCSDEETQITQSILFLLNDHDALIITGGLGPTSDDRTRFALAKAINQSLIFNDDSWERLQAFFERVKLSNQPASNRHQAMFPDKATILENKVGTADACWLEYEGKLIFMLPGPPHECLPIFENAIVPLLKNNEFIHDTFRKKWLFLGVSEGQLGEEMDSMAAPLNITTGYRVAYPYVEFKAQAESPGELEQFEKNIAAHLARYRVNEQSIPASTLLIEFLANVKETIHIIDEATHGFLKKSLLTIENIEKLKFNDENREEDIVFEIDGLDDVWREDTFTATTTLRIRHNNKDVRFEIPFRGKRSLKYATEVIAREIYNQLQSI